MKSFLLLLSLFSQTVVAVTLDSSLQGKGLESLMNGVGLARTGSQGALTSNPSLLAWLPKQKEFTSTNQLSFYKFHKKQSGLEMKVSPNFVPVYAVTSEGYGSWGYAYGLVVDSMKIKASGVNEGFTTFTKSEQQLISFNYGFGALWNEIAYGASLSFGRYSTEQDTFFSGTSGITKITGNSSSATSFWHGSAVLGMSKQYSSWAVGLSAAFTFVNFGAEASERQETFDTFTNNFSHSTNRDLPALELVPALGLGIKKELAQSRFYLDVNYTPSYTDHDEGEGHVSSYLFYFMGWERDLDDRYALYSGFAFSPEKKDEDLKDSGSLSLGLSQKGKHSLHYVGVSWYREFERVDTELFRLILGTKFQY